MNMTEAELKDVQEKAMQIARLRLRIESGMRIMSRPKIWMPKEPPSFRKRVYLKISNFVWRMLGQP